MILFPVFYELFRCLSNVPAFVGGETFDLDTNFDKLKDYLISVRISSSLLKTPFN